MNAVATARTIRYAATVSADLSELAVTRDVLATALDECGWGDEDAFRVLVCADEAMANALTHGSESGGTVAVRFRLSPDRVALTVSDGSSGELPAGSPPVPDTSDEHGRGLILMRALSDAFRVRRSPSRTTVALAFQGGAS